MTVYELIQELAQYDPDLEVRVELSDMFNAYVDIPEEEEIDQDRNMLLPVEINDEFGDYSLRQSHPFNGKTYVKLEVSPN